MSSGTETTQLLTEISRGSDDAARRLMPIVYDELRSLAARYMRREPATTLQPTALVHEAFLRLAGPEPLSCRDRGHFLALAATAMRHTLVDRARRRRARKHGGDRQRITFDEHLIGEEQRDVDLLTLDDALGRLEALDPRAARVVELRFSAGASIDETAEVLGIARSTVTEDWRMARSWLQAQLVDPEGV